MVYLLVKAVISGLIIGVVSEVARLAPPFGADRVAAAYLTAWNIWLVIPLISLSPRCSWTAIS